MGSCSISRGCPSLTLQTACWNLSTNIWKCPSLRWWVTTMSQHGKHRIIRTVSNKCVHLVPLSTLKVSPILLSWNGEVLGGSLSARCSLNSGSLGLNCLYWLSIRRQIHQSNPAPGLDLQASFYLLRVTSEFEVILLDLESVEDESLMCWTRNGDLKTFFLTGIFYFSYSIFININTYFVWRTAACQRTRWCRK